VVQVDYARFGEPVLIVAPKVDDSGGFRPTGSYPTDELFASPGDQGDAPGQEAGTGHTLDENSPSGDEKLN
jgi:hypothetical protein